MHEFLEQMHNRLQHLYGRWQLSEQAAQRPIDDTWLFLQKCSASEFFDFIELSFKLNIPWRIMYDENEVVDAINEIFRIENAPYQLTRIVKVELPPSSNYGVRTETVEFPKVIKAEEEVVHQEAVLPALAALSDPRFRVANREFREALDDYREGRYSDCVTKCGSAFESVLKILCKKNRWRFDEERATTKDLLDLVVPKLGLAPFFTQPLMLIATIRNRLGSAHGGGTDARSVEPHVAQYTITSTAAAVLLLINQDAR